MYDAVRVIYILSITVLDLLDAFYSPQDEF